MATGNLGAQTRHHPDLQQLLTRTVTMLAGTVTADQ